MHSSLCTHIALVHSSVAARGSHVLSLPVATCMLFILLCKSHSNWKLEHYAYAVRKFLGTRSRRLTTCFSCFQPIIMAHISMHTVLRSVSILCLLSCCQASLLSPIVAETEIAQVFGDASEPNQMLPQGNVTDLSRPKFPMARCQGLVLEEATIDELQHAMSEGRLTSTQLAMCYLQRMFQTNEYIKCVPIRMTLLCWHCAYIMMISAPCWN